EKQEEPTAEAQPAGSLPSTPQSVRGVKVETKRPREAGRKRNPAPSKRGHRCSTYGCNRTFLNMQELIHHVSIHYKPTQSMQDKKFVCSIIGCGEMLDSMQDLMSHLKVHYKPNRYFKCENCMQHFRTHRSLFKHLHVCSDNAARAASQGTASVPASDSESATPAGPASRQTSVIQCVKKDAAFPVSDDTPTTSMAAVASTSTLPGGHLSSMSNLVSQATNSFPAYDPNLFAGRAPGPSPTSAANSYLPYMNPSTYNLPQASISQRLKPFLGNQSLPASNAMWKKNQGHTANSRIIWEHTRGNYRCMQCNFSTPTRDQMDKHIELFHKNPPSTRMNEIDYDVDLLSFHSKVPAEMESDLLP
ncbi:hypothetical protein GDO78_012107, partial [Eleutherodactylus coqui]